MRFAAVELLCGWATTEDGRSSLVTALDALVGQVRSGNEERTALRVLDSLHHRYYGPRPIGALDAVTEALRAAGLTHSASEVALAAALAGMDAEEGAFDRWDRWLALSGERPGSLDAVGQQWRASRAAMPFAAIGAVVTGLRAHGSATAELAAVCLVARAGEGARWAQPWPAELAALRGSAYADVAEAALLADARRLP
ncbi:hypothetical protein ACWD6R_25600 [Streptomyces sp. NPDC005151]